MRSLTHLTFVALLAIILGLATPASATTLEIDFAQTNGTIRPLHGINKGPLVGGGLIDLTAQHRALGIPFVRLHDCHWPNPDVVDIHTVFPNFDVDPALPASYDFAPTDEYLAAIRASGAQIVFRLGESIEHTKTKRFVHPPRDFAKWTQICLGIIRHYNEGWANGFRHDIRYWEIWNEPENRPAMWTGTDDQFLQLYATAARGIKQHFPQLKVGGPAFGYSGKFERGAFVPSDFVLKFLEMCRRDRVPLDFFSWHCYTDRPLELVERARAIRQLLDRHGFARTESHLNEWNYLPHSSWSGLSKSAAPEVRQQFYDAMGGAPGAAFTVAALLHLQDAPLDMANFFHGEVGGFGLFNENGVPLKTFHAMRAFRELLDAPARVATTGDLPGSLTVCAGLSADRRHATILLSNTGPGESLHRIELRNLPWRDSTTHEIRVLDAERNLETTERGTNVAIGAIEVRLQAPAVALISLQTSAGK